MKTLTHEELETLRGILVKHYANIGCDIVSREIQKDDEWLYMSILRDEMFDFVFELNGSH